jgi:hypothetical protein
MGERGLGERGQPVGGMLILAVVLAGLAGGAAGGLLVGARAPAATAMGSRPAAPESQVTADSGAEAVRELARLVEVLIDEVRGLRVAPARREPAPGGTASAPAQASTDAGALVAAIEDLTRALDSSGAAGGDPAARPLSARPPAPARNDLIRALAQGEDDVERLRPHMFWTRQQVLEHFGQPRSISGIDDWLYVDPTSGERLWFRFEQGLLVRVSPHK